MLVLLTLLAGMVWVVWGVMKSGYYIPEIATQFFIMGLVSGVIGAIFRLNGMRFNDIASSFRQGASDLVVPTSGTLMCSLAVARIDWSTWVRFMWKYLGILVLCAAAAILLASLTGF